MKGATGGGDPREKKERNEDKAWTVAPRDKGVPYRKKDIAFHGQTTGQPKKKGQEPELDRPTLPRPGARRETQPA